MYKETTKTIIESLRNMATKLTPCNEKAEICVLAAANRLEIADSRVHKLYRQRAILIRALMVTDSPLGGPTCPRDLEYLDEQCMSRENYLGFRCMHKDFDGQCPFEGRDEGASEDDIYGCWMAWLEGREIG